MAKFTHILLVEDDPITILVSERIIKMTVFADEVTSYENGRVALDYLLSIRKKKVMPEIIFLDINMPVMNGWEFLVELDKLKSGFEKLPDIYMLSSTVDPEDYTRAKEFLLVKGFISKPLSREVLKKIE